MPASQLLGLHAREALPVGESSDQAVCPPAEHLEALMPLIDMGAISDLADWADQFASEHPQWQDFAAQVRRHADHADLNQLRALVLRCQAI